MYLQAVTIDGHVDAVPSPRPPGRFDTSWLIVDGTLLPSDVSTVKLVKPQCRC